MCVGMAHKALLSQRCKTDQNRREARDWEKHALGHHAEIGLWKPLIVVLGDQEPCTADRGCRIVSVEIVVLLSSLLLTCRAGVLQSPSITVVLN